VLIVTVVRLSNAATLSGRISDQSGESGLDGATVKVRLADHFEPWRVLQAGDDGRFSISDLSAGDYVVTISFVGFGEQSFTVSVKADDSLVHDISLVPAPINMQAILVTASRVPEKVVEAPAAVSIVPEERIASRTTLTPTEHLKGLPAADVATTGLNQSSMVVRGFNNIFSGALLVLVDNRIARVPSLRYNAYQFIPTISEDIERIELISGPGSALYGPNSANGVLHILTKSPFRSQGTTVSVGAGERDLVMTSIRHAGSYKGRIGYKVSGQYYRGMDWKEHDPLEPKSIRLFRPTSNGPVYESDFFPNERDFETARLAGEGRIDYFPGNSTSITVNGGFSRIDNIELTGLGAAQAIGWTTWYAQTRLRYKDLYVGGFVNASDAGDTYLLRSGQLIIDRSKFWAIQAQHKYRFRERLSLTYGVDVLLTRPETESTINGRNEYKDNIDEVGGYLQSEFKFSDKLKLIGAGRIDKHSSIESPVWSPRAAMVYQPEQNHSLRITFNRAYQTPDNTNLYLDILQAPDGFGVGAAFEPALGFRPSIDIRAQGVPETGFHWSFDDSGNPRFRSPFAPLDPRGISSTDFIDLNDPVFTNIMWQVARGAVISGYESQLSEYGLDASQVSSIAGAIDSTVSSTVSNVDNAMRIFNPEINGFEPTTAKDIVDIDRLRPAITQTFELGYKGSISDRFRFNADIYATRKFDFIGPLAVEAPNVFLDPATLEAELAAEVLDGYSNASASERATLDSIDLVSLGGNGNGTPVDELVEMFTSDAASIPFGTVSPREALDPDAVLVTMRNFGDITFFGADLSVDIQINQHVALGGTYSYISSNFFSKGSDQPSDIYLNAPKHKFGLHVSYASQQHRLITDARLRWVDAFEMTSPFMGSSVSSFVVLDVSCDWRFLLNTRLTLSVQNLLDNRHREFIGAPEIGRLAILRLSQMF